MSWKSTYDLRGVLSKEPHISHIENAFYLRELVDGALLQPDYESSESWPRIVTLSEAGSHLASAAKQMEGLSDADLSFAALIVFYHHDLLIDPTRSDLDEIERLLSREIAQGAIVLPHRFGRLLYDRFFEQFPDERPEHLDPDAALDFLSGTPHGVYQAGDLVSGPFGILRSREKRYIPISRHLPLWHCADPGCQAIHRVRLMAHSCPVLRAVDVIREIAIDELGPPSDWDNVLSCLHRQEAWSLGRPFSDLPTIIADSVQGEERSTLLSIALESGLGGSLRELTGRLLGKKAANGPASDVAARLDGAQQLQLLWTLSDADIIPLLDNAVFTKKIAIPPHEVRRSRYIVVTREGDARCELSALGVRSAKARPPTEILVGIWNAYRHERQMEELGWRLNRRAGEPRYDDLSRYLRDKGTRAAIAELVLASLPICAHVAREQQLNISQIDDEATLIDRILWKYGFHPPTYDDELILLRMRIDQIDEAAIALGEPKSEPDRAKLRSAGVNLFVSVEWFLQSLIAFNVWLLTSDHFLESQYVYDATKAIAMVSAVLPPDDMATWDPKGNNTLGVLVAYLTKTAHWITSLLETDRIPLSRTERDLPHYADDSGIMFPLKHCELWADCAKSELTVYSRDFAAISTIINRSDLASIRNGLDHQRTGSEFPTVQSILQCTARIREALRLVDEPRYFPKAQWLQSMTTDSFGNKTFVFVDHAARQTVLEGPALARGILEPVFNIPFLVAPGNLLGLPNSHLLFRLFSDSPYSRYWANYPRRPQAARPQVTTLGNAVPSNNSGDAFTAEPYTQSQAAPEARQGLV